MYKSVGKSQITNSVIILMSVEIITIITERLTQSVAVIQHRSHAVESETVELIFFHPELAVGQQEVQYFILSIVEAERIPSRMFSSVASVEILIRITGKITKALKFILHGMRVNKVHNHRYTHLVSSIYKFLKFIRSTES